MDFKRKTYDILRQWKKKPSHKPVVVQGLRQVGKSYVVRKFALENYENVIVFDFRYDEKFRRCFEKSLAVDDIIHEASAFVSGASFAPHKTVLIFEEIGDCERARTALKSFYLDGRFDVIATGSLLGVENYRRKAKSFMPTGYEEYIEMQPMDFEEFLWASGVSDEAIQLLSDSIKNVKDLPSSYELMFEELLKRYIVVGGMPEAVDAFLTNNGGYLNARDVQLRLLNDYKCDFGRFVNDDGKESIDYSLQAKLNEVFSSIPSQLSRESGNSKFKISDVSKGGRLSSYESAIQWLNKAGLINIAYNVNAIEKPLALNKNLSCFKLFLADTGLLMASYPIVTLQDFLSDNLDSRKGAIFENLMATMLAKFGGDMFFYSDTKRHLEIDFLLETNEGIILLEEKTTNGKMAASKAVMHGETPYKVAGCVKFIKQGFGVGEFFTSLPQYAAPWYLEQRNLSTKESIKCKQIDIL